MILYRVTSLPEIGPQVKIKPPLTIASSDSRGYSIPSAVILRLTPKSIQVVPPPPPPVGVGSVGGSVVTAPPPDPAPPVVPDPPVPGLLDDELPPALGGLGAYALVLGVESTEGAPEVPRL